jgi:hypothetical protein
MKSIIRIIALMGCSIVLFGCSLGISGNERVVNAPEPAKLEIEGSYSYLSVVPLEGTAEISESDYRNLTAYFDTREARVGSEIVKLPEYKVKLVNVFDFLLNRYRLNPSRLNLKDGEMEVYDISTENKSFYQVFSLEKDMIGIIQGKNFIKLVRSGDAAPTEQKTSGAAPEMDMAFDSSSKAITYQPKAGVLIGLKSERTAEEGSSYRTLWIYSTGEYQNAYEVSDILFPRKEFMLLSVERYMDDDKVYESLLIKPVGRQVITENELGTPVITAERYIDVGFVGNDYIGISQGAGISDRDNSLPYQKILAVDNYTEYRGVNITEIAGVEGMEALGRSYESESIRDSSLQAMGGSIGSLAESLAMVRKNGHWVLTARLNSAKEPAKDYSDITVSLIPPAKLVTYDELQVSWSRIKEMVPEAKDVINAPGNAFVIVRTPRYLIMFMYDENMNLLTKPVMTIALDEDEEIIMAEWARGDFVDRWTETAASAGVKVQPEVSSADN